MDGPISTSEAAGPAQRAIPIPFRRPPVGPPEKVDPVSEGNRSRASVREETDRPVETIPNALAGDRKAEPETPAETQAPAYYVELRQQEEAGSDRDSLPGKSPEPPAWESLAEALAAAKARWVEVNKETLEANTPDPTALPEKDSRYAQTIDGLQRRLTTPYDLMARSLSNPHPTQPLIDVFV